MRGLRNTLFAASITAAGWLLCESPLMAQENESAPPADATTVPVPAAPAEALDAGAADKSVPSSAQTDPGPASPAPTNDDPAAAQTPVAGTESATEPSASTPAAAESSASATDAPASASAAPTNDDPAAAQTPAAGTESATDAPVAAAPAAVAVVAEPPASTPAAAGSSASATDAPAPASAAQPAAGAQAADTGSGITMAALLAMLKSQQAQIDKQDKLIAELQAKAGAELATEKETTTKQAAQIEQQRQTMASMQSQIDQINQQKADDLTEEEVALRSRLETLESSITTSQEAASTAFDEDSFPNSTMIPGTNAAMRMGGFVKMNVVETLDPLSSLDRFIAGSIPVPQETSTPRTTMTVSQSRLNYDLRDKTQYGTLRAFIEGDFAGDGTTFRLRHAFGQYKDILAGQTWSVFQDSDAAPEEIDFEGINGAVNVRQPQIRYFPKIGKDWDLMFSVEDPNPEITGGTATSQWPDLVASARKTWFERWHVRTSVVLRQITGIWADDLTGDTESQVTGWGVSLSGKTATRFWNSKGLDNFMFQFNAGEGIGRYINDLNTVGGEDAIFDSTGELYTLPAFAGYVAYQHWWKANSRSTINLSWVDVSNLDFETDDAYNKTFRGAINYIWSPASRIDLGAEIIYGTRQNKDGEKAKATQVQLSSKYRF